MKRKTNGIISFIVVIALSLAMILGGLYIMANELYTFKVGAIYGTLVVAGLILIHCEYFDDDTYEEDFYDD